METEELKASQRPWEPPAFQRGGQPVAGTPFLISEWNLPDGTPCHLLADYSPTRTLRVEQYNELSDRWVAVDVPPIFQVAFEHWADSLVIPLELPKT